MRRPTNQATNITRFYERLASALLAIALCMVMIFGAFFMHVYNRNIYSAHYERERTYERVADLEGIALEAARTTVADITVNTLAFLQGKEPLRYFSPEERAHMQDVKIVFWRMQAIYYCSIAAFVAGLLLIYLIAKKHYMKLVARICMGAGIGILITAAFIALMTMFYFDASFTVMHLLLFPQGNWQFPADSLLITVFDESFFYEMGIKMLFAVIIQATIIAGIGVWIKRKISLSGA